MDGLDRWTMKPGTATVSRDTPGPGDLIVMPVREHEREIDRLIEAMRDAVDELQNGRVEDAIQGLLNAADGVVR